ncbi:MAG: sugar ABC transporter permease, partial [Spirochaetales bacterium]|nr:sugar ABC transporter permease [Spirochaetales bacterium]
MKKDKNSSLKAGFMFATPGLLIFLLVVIVPFIYGFYLTFTDWNGVSDAKSLVGFTNYIKTFQDVEFWRSMALTLRYVVITV